MRHAVPTFQTLLQKFFTQRLMQEKQVSPNTISSYRDTFKLLLRFAEKRLHMPPEKLSFESLDAPLVAAFLSEQEKGRGVTVRTRNLRLTAIRSFFRFAAYEMPENSAQIQRVLAMPTKRFDRKLIDFLTRPEADALLAAPDKKTWIGRRDHALLLTTLQTGMRLGQYNFATIKEVQNHATRWLWTYNNERPNMGLSGITPAQKLNRQSQLQTAA